MVKSLFFVLAAFATLKSAVSMDESNHCHLINCPWEIQHPLIQSLEPQGRVHLFNTCQTLNRVGRELYYPKMNPLLKKVTWAQLTFPCEGELVRFNLHIIKLAQIFYEYCSLGGGKDGQLQE